MSLPDDRHAKRLFSVKAPDLEGAVLASAGDQVVVTTESQGIDPPVPTSQRNLPFVFFLGAPQKSLGIPQRTLAILVRHGEPLAVRAEGEGIDGGLAEGRRIQN